MTTPVLTNRIVCAANYSNSTGVMLLGVRHCDLLMKAQRGRLADKGRNEDWQQGFIDRYGEFQSRTEAWSIAVAANQILRRCGGDSSDGGTLYSENLY